MKEEYREMVTRIPIIDKDYDHLYSNADTFFGGLVRELTGRGNDSGMATFVLIAGLLVLLFLLLPTINLVNLNMTRIMERSSEIGVRKAFGASSRTLVYQFIVENIILTVIGGIIGLILSVIVLQFINSLELIKDLHLSLNINVLLIQYRRVFFLWIIVWRLPGMAHVAVERGHCFKGSIIFIFIPDYMIKHLFKIIWNKKKKNFLLLCEMFISFLVMFAVFTLIVNYYRSYKTSMGFTDQNVWAVNFDSHHKFATADSAQLFYETLRRNIQELPQVKEVSFCGNNYPFANSTSNTDINFNGKRISSVNFYRADARYLKTLDVQLLEGRWFDQQDLIAAHKPIVINATLKKEIAGNGPAVGQIHRA
jgi:cell division protein FtsX